MYGYLTWAIVLGVIWIFAYALNPKLRQKILWSSWIAFPFGLGELYFIPNYWMPQTLFNLGLKYSIDIEAFLLMFFLGGIAAYVYEGIFKKHLPSKQKICHPMCKCYTPFIATLVTFIVLIKGFPQWNIIYPSSIACLAGGAFAYLIYPKLRNHIIFGGFLFAFLYWITIFISDLFVPWVAVTWNMSALSGITLLRVPIEEIFFGFTFGTLWAPLFEEVCSNLKGHK